MRLLAIDHPRYAETIDAHPEPRSPERGRERHLDCSIFRKSTEYLFTFRRVVERERHGKALWLLVMSRRCVGSHYDVVANNHRGMQNLIVPFGGNVFRRGGAGVFHDRL